MAKKRDRQRGRWEVVGEYTVRKTNKEKSVQNAFRLKFINFSAHFRTHSARLKRDEGLVGRGGARGC